MAVDKPPSSQQNGTATFHSRANGNAVSAAKDAEHAHPETSVVTHDSQTTEGKGDIDEFELPVKKPPRPSRSSEQDEATLRDRGANASGQHDGETHAVEEIAMKASTHGVQLGVSESCNIPSQPPPISTSPNCKAKDISAGHPASATSHAVVDSILHGHTGSVSGWSHQALAPQKVNPEENKEEDEWQSMPAYAPYDLYDDDGHLIAKEAPDSDEEANAYHGLGGAGKGYTRVQHDEDAKSTTSMDENTDYLFKPKDTGVVNDDEDQRDPLAQLQATKELLTEGQRIAYVGLTRLGMAEMLKQMEAIEPTKKTAKKVNLAIENMKMWSQQMMVRLYMHMDIDSSEQIMIEQLAQHGVLPGDLTPALMQNARVKNPMADRESADGESLKSPKLNGERRPSATSSIHRDSRDEAADADAPPPYQEHNEAPMPEVRTPSQLGISKKIDIDLRWTILCDLFLLLLADSIYDARSRTLLERVGLSLEVAWIDICRFEKRVTDSLEMQEAANKETWDEAEHLESRRKMALKRRYMMMGLATVGGGLVIGLSAGVLAPVIGAGLAAGFSTIGVAGTSSFLAGAGGTAIITSGAVLTGGTIGVRASNRRTGAVKTFEYRPLHNNKRVNLILTVSGWMSGKVDDVRLPFSTVDPVMGDIYSLLWEPEMLQSMGQTINILASEALSQSIQQVLGSTILISLMAALQLPIVLTKLSYLIDNPWAVSMGRANAAGLILADSLIDRNLGVRPITLVGFSLGARVIFACLRELADKGAFGLIQNVYLFGSPIVADKDEYLRCRSVISGRFVNGYASNDWILGYLFRATSGGIRRVAGLAQVEGIEGLENIDVTKHVNGHMAYRAAMPKLLREVGWEVESDEFTEIEDPDPDNHDKRQRELIRELDEARKEAEAKPEKKRFGFFKRGKVAEKKAWETYDDRLREPHDDFSTSAADTQGNVLFDIEAIKRELESEQIDVRELESTLPPMKLTVDDFRSDQESPRSNLRETRSYDASPVSGPKGAANTNGSSKENPFNQGYDEYNTSNETVPAQARLSFEAPRKDTSSPQQLSPQLHPPQQLPSKSPTVASPRPSSPLKEEVHPNAAPTPPQRPSLRTSMSSPPPSGSAPVGVEHNAWADEEEDDFGQEKEVKLTF